MSFADRSARYSKWKLAVEKSMHWEGGKATGPSQGKKLPFSILFTFISVSQFSSQSIQIIVLINVKVLDIKKMKWRHVQVSSCLLSIVITMSMPSRRSHSILIPGVYLLLTARPWMDKYYYSWFIKNSNLLPYAKLLQIVHS